MKFYIAAIWLSSMALVAAYFVIRHSSKTLWLILAAALGCFTVGGVTGWALGEVFQ